jgi:hypothetical protein
MPEVTPIRPTALVLFPAANNAGAEMPAEDMPELMSQGDKLLFRQQSVVDHDAKYRRLT